MLDPYDQFAACCVPLSPIYMLPFPDRPKYPHPFSFSRPLEDVYLYMVRRWPGSSGQVVPVVVLVVVVVVGQGRVNVVTPDPAWSHTHIYCKLPPTFSPKSHSRTETEQSQQWTFHSISVYVGNTASIPFGERGTCTFINAHIREYRYSLKWQLH